MLSNGFIGVQIHLEYALELENKKSYYKLIKRKVNVHPGHCVKHIDESLKQKRRK